MAEFIIYSSRNIYKQISEMIKNGDIANMLIKPVNFACYIFAEECSNIVQILVNAVFGIVLGFIFAGTMDVTFVQILFIIASVLVAIITQILLQILIGLISFFTEENSSFYLILSKFQLLLVLTPLELYPIVLQKVFYCLPITYSIYVPAKLLVHFDISSGLKLIGLEIISLFILILITSLLYKKGVKKLNVNGG